MHGWANRILRVDLSDMRVWAQETAPYVPAYLGARGVAARLCWDEYPEPVGAFEPANPLMVFTEALTGSRSPNAGRTNVCAFSPQASPYPWCTRSSIGGRFGGELKRAGYDGIVVTGASEVPVRVRIRDDEVTILSAHAASGDNLWGLDTMDTLEALEAAEGKGVPSVQGRIFGQHLYGSADAVDPLGGYGGKARMGHWHTVRSVILDCVPVDDLKFPLIYNPQMPDGYWHLDVDGIGQIEGPEVEYQLFRVGTGLDWSQTEFERAAERVCMMERALQVRHWGRGRHMDETLLPYFEEPDAFQSPFQAEHLCLDREQFKPVLDEFYALHGWDPQTGQPTREGLGMLDLDDVYGPMVEGAAQAGKEGIGPRA